MFLFRLGRIARTRGQIESILHTSGSSEMDPRRAWELNEAAAKGAARRAAAEATQRSVQGALRSERGDNCNVFSNLWSA